MSLVRYEHVRLLDKSITLPLGVLADLSCSFLILACFTLTLDQLWVCRKGKSKQVGYPVGVATQMQSGATLGMCEDDLPLQYRGNY